MSNKFTEFQQLAVNSGEKNILVSASAGCGKTTVMIERVINLLKKGHSLNQMIICTFTKAAAADMRQKLFTRLTLDVAGGQEYAKKQLEILPSASISTLHTFCSRLIKNYFYAVEIDPNFEVASDSDASALLNSCVDKVITRLYNSGDKDFLFLYEVFLRNRKTARLAGELTKLYRFASVQPSFDGWLDNAMEEIKNHDKHVEQLKEYYGVKLRTILSEAERLLSDTVKNGFKRNFEACDALVTAIKNRHEASVSAYGKVPADFIYVELNDRFKSLKNDYNNLLSEYGEAVNSVDAIKTEGFLRVFVSAVKEIKEEYEKEKRRKALVDYEDLEQLALKILNNETAAEEIKQTYKFMFVDEYQDINPIQEKIISSVEADKFFVGDVKQSIYGFRMCEPQIFLEKYKNYQDGVSGQNIGLNSNFRSNGGILNFCNTVFSSIMTETLGQINYKNTSCFKLKEENEGFDGVSFKVVTGKEEDDGELAPVYSCKNHAAVEELTLAKAESRLIADYILETVSGKMIESNGEKIPVSYKDIAILLRAASGGYLEALKGTLKEAGIPVCMVEKKRADECPAINVLIHYLRLINNFNDDIALAAVMRSCFGGFTDDELCDIRTSFPSGKINFYKAVLNYAGNKDIENSDLELRQKLNGFLAKVNRYVEFSYSLTASALAGMICAENEYFKFVLSLKGGELMARELACFLDIIDNGVFNSSLSEMMLALAREMPDVEVAPGGDAVKIMTVHSSKGLEFPFVILANIGRKFDKRDLRNKILLESKSGAAFTYFDPLTHKSVPTALYLLTKLSMGKKLLEEEMRILYVALTRAKYSLALFGAAAKLPKNKDGIQAQSFLEWLTPCVEYKEVDILDCRLDFAKPSKRIMFKKPDPLLAEKIKEYIKPLKAHKHRAVKSAVTLLSKGGDEESNAQEVLFLEDSAALVKGSAYHLFMETADFSGNFLTEYNKFLSLGNSGAELINKEELKTAFEIFKNKTAGKKVYRELPFIADINVDGGDMLVQGVIDMLIASGSGYEIIDYKTGSLYGDKLIKYKKQLEIYAQATEKILKIKIETLLIYSFTKGEFIRV